jgi:2-polyprenyl-3-methyl-5-hydroxy-6-metoxy-1,4-benzoquinol methylase
MDRDMIARLNLINRDFYATVADEFDATRGRAWMGWKPLRPWADQARSVLDVGCGNGRFALWLGAGDRLYCGVDGDARLLEHARTALAEVDGLQTTLVRRDVVTQGVPRGAFDLVVAFGMLHHVPGYANRQDFMRRLASRVRPGGALAVSAWQFMDDARMRARVVPFPAEIAPYMEAGDALLDWRRGERALRYCHHIDAAELDSLIAASGLPVLNRWSADGASGHLNAYVLLGGV